MQANGRHRIGRQVFLIVCKPLNVKLIKVTSVNMFLLNKCFLEIVLNGRVIAKSMLAAMLRMFKFQKYLREEDIINIVNGQ